MALEKLPFSKRNDLTIYRGNNIIDIMAEKGFL